MQSRDREVRRLTDAPLSNVRQLIHFLSYYAVVDNGNFHSGSHLRPALISKIEVYYAGEDFHPALKLLKLKTRLTSQAAGTRNPENIPSLVVEIKNSLRKPRLSGIFWLMIDSSTLSNPTDQSRITSVTTTFRRLFPNNSNLSTLEICGNNLLSAKNSIEPEATPDCGNADVPVRLAMALELMNRKRFEEAYIYLGIVTNLAAPEIMPGNDDLLHLLAMTEFVKCCNILNKEHEGEKSARKALAHATEAHHQVQVCSLRITLADALIGQKEYARAKTTLEGILDGECPSDHLKTIASLRLSKIDRRLGVLSTPCLSPSGHLGQIFLSPHHVPVDLMNECIDELASTCSSIRQQNDKNSSTSINHLAQIKSAIPVNLNLPGDWRVLALHEQISSIVPSPNPKHREHRDQSVIETSTTSPLNPVNDNYPTHRHSTVHAKHSPPNRDLSLNIESPRPNAPPGTTSRLYHVDEPRWSGYSQQEQQLISGQTILPQTHHVQPNHNGPKLPCHLLHPHETRTEFFGRQYELKLIDQTFFPDPPASSSSNLRSFMISGLGGMGKTQTANQYASLNKHRFEAIFWLHADNISVLADGFARISQELGLKLEGNQNLALSREKVKSWLSNPVRLFDEKLKQPDEVTWLLILDSVNDVSVLQDYWPAGSHGSVLITSRRPLSDMGCYSIKSGIDLMPLNFLETIDFMRSFTGISEAVRQEHERQELRGQSNGFQDLAASACILEGLPLAISRLGNIIDCSDISIRDFVNTYGESQQQLSFRKMKTLDVRYNRFLARVWNFDTLSSEANFILHLISLLPADCIPEKALTHGIFDILKSYHKAREVLVRSSLITYNESDRQIAIHRVVQDVIRRTMDPSRYGQILDTAFLLLKEAWPSQSLGRRYGTYQWHLCAELLPSVLSLTSYLKGAMSVDTPAKGYKPDDFIATLLNEVGWYGYPQQYQLMTDY